MFLEDNMKKLFITASKFVKKWWNGTPTELTMDEIMALSGDYNDKLIKTKSSVVAHTIWDFWLKKWYVLIGLIIAVFKI